MAGISKFIVLIGSLLGFSYDALAEVEEFYIVSHTDKGSVYISTSQHYVDEVKRKLAEKEYVESLQNYCMKGGRFWILSGRAPLQCIKTEVDNRSVKIRFNSDINESFVLLSTKPLPEQKWRIRKPTQAELADASSLTKLKEGSGAMDRSFALKVNTRVVETGSQAVPILLVFPQSTVSVGSLQG